MSADKSLCTSSATFGRRAFDIRDAEGSLARSADAARRSYIREFGKQVAMGPYPVLGHFPVCEDRQKRIARVVGERPSIDRKGRGPSRIIGHDLWQERR